MILFFLFLLVVCLYRIKISRHGYFYDFLEREQTNSIKGIFIFFVFLRHILQYIRRSGYDFSSHGDAIVTTLDSKIGQLIVVMFLFYSGYGVMESIRKKGDNYIRNIPRHRILPIIINFNIAILCFLLIDFYFGISVPMKKIILSTIGWDSVGNSNWYIFDILLCYLVTFVAFCLPKHRMAFVGVGILISILFLSYCKSPWWYNTLLAYFAGIVFSECREKIVIFWERHYWKSLMALCVFFIGIYVVAIMFLSSTNIISGLLYNIASIVFALLIVQVTMKVNISNKYLVWFGMNLFPLYIYQRIPMIVLYEIDNGYFVQNNVIAYIVICFAIMCCIAFLYKYWQFSFCSPKKY